MFNYSKLETDDRSDQDLQRAKEAAQRWYELQNKLMDVQREIGLADPNLSVKEKETKEVDIKDKFQSSESDLKKSLSEVKTSTNKLQKIQEAIQKDHQILLGYEQQLELIKLKKYPSGERAATGIAKALMAILIGASTVVTIVLVGTVLHPFILGGLAFGAGAYAIKAIRDIYKRNKEEKRLTTELQKKSNEIDALFANNGAFSKCKLDDVFTLIAQNKVVPEEIESLHKKLVKVQESLQIVFPGCDQKKEIKQRIAEKISILEDKHQHLEQKKLSIQLPHLSESGRQSLSLRRSRSVTNLVKANPSVGEKVKEAGSWSWTKMKQLGNRTLSFMGGAAAAASVGVGVAIIVFGVSNPAGWILLGILGASVLVGAAAVTIDYVASRRQERKIQELTDRTKDFTTIKDGIESDAASINHIFDVADKHSKQMDEERQKNEKIQLELRKKEEELISLKENHEQLKKQLQEQSVKGLVSATNDLFHNAIPAPRKLPNEALHNNVKSESENEIINKPNK